MDQQLYALAHYHRQQNIAEEAIAHSTDLWRQFFINAEGDIVDTAFVEALQTFRNLHPNMELPRATLDGPPNYPWINDILNNTSSYLPTVQCPVLCMFGALDGLVPPQKSIHQLRSGLENAGQKPPTVIMYERVGRSFTLPGFRIIPGFFMDQIRFIREALEMD